MWDDRNGLAQRVLGHIGAILAVDQNRPGLRVIKPLHQRKDRRFPGPGRSDDSNPSTRFYLEVQRCENLPAGRVCKADVAEFDGAARGDEPARARMFDEFMRNQKRAKRFGKTRPMLSDIDQGDGQVARRRKDRKTECTDEHDVACRRMSSLPK